MRMRSLSRKNLHHQQFLLGSRLIFYWTVSMAGCSFERALQTIRSPLQRISAISRLFSTVRGYNHSIPATGPRTLDCNKLHGRQPHGYLTSLTGRATIHMNSLIRSNNVPCSYSALRHCRRCIHSTSSESFC